MQSKVKGKEYKLDRSSAAPHIQKEAEAKTVIGDLDVAGFGVEVDRSDPQFSTPYADAPSDDDDVAVGRCDAVGRAKTDAAGEGYDPAADDFILKELRSYPRQRLAATKRAQIQQALSRAHRTGRDPAPDAAHARAFGRKMERSTQALLKVFACELKERKHMAKTRGKIINHHLTVNVHGNTIVQNSSVTITHAPAISVFTTIRASIEESAVDAREKIALLEALHSVEQAKDRPSFLERSKQLLGVVSACTQLAPDVIHWSHALNALAKAVFS